MRDDASSQALETPRLRLRSVALSDAAFVLRLLNDPSWLENIGDRGVRSIDDAERYIKNNIWAHFQTYGFGMYAIELKAPRLPIGFCGLVKREYLSSPDLGFALLPDYVGCGYAGEAAGRVLSHARNDLDIAQLCAIVKHGNDRSARLLDRLGFHFQGPYLTPQGEEVGLYEHKHSR